MKVVFVVYRFFSLNPSVFYIVLHRRDVGMWDADRFQ